MHAEIRTVSGSLKCDTKVTDKAAVQPHQLADISPHIFLKTNGGDVTVVQELLRHSTARLTLDTYTQALSLHERAAPRSREVDASVGTVQREFENLSKASPLHYFKDKDAESEEAQEHANSSSPALTHEHQLKAKASSRRQIAGRDLSSRLSSRVSELFVQRLAGPGKE